MIILQDPSGLESRFRCLQQVQSDVIAISPIGSAQHTHTLPVSVPENWLPESSIRSLAKQCWFKAEAVGYAAVKQYKLLDDFYWFIESDVAAKPEVLRALFDSVKDNKTDLLSAILWEPQSTLIDRYSNHPAFRRKPNLCCTQAITRLSRKALLAGIKHAENLRNCFSEVALPYAVQEEGLSIAKLDPEEHFISTKTFACYPHHIAIDVTKINHPVKQDILDFK